jgi:hypothetical protein
VQKPLPKYFISLLGPSVAIVVGASVTISVGASVDVLELSSLQLKAGPEGKLSTQSSLTLQIEDLQ